MIALAAAANVLAVGPVWSVTCRPGEDEFASNCQARVNTRGVKIELATGDSQLFLTVEAPACHAGQNGVQRNWWRDEVAGLAAPKRRRMLLQEMAQGYAELRTHCPQLPPEPPRLGSLPDIAVHGDP